MGFFVQRHTLKLSILAAILKPNIRSIEPNIEPNLDSSRGLCLPKRLGTSGSAWSTVASFPYVSVCPTVRLNLEFWTFLVWAYVSFPSCFYSRHSPPSSHYYFPTSRLRLRRERSVERLVSYVYRRLCYLWHNMIVPSNGLQSQETNPLKLDSLSMNTSS